MAESNKTDPLSEDANNGAAQWSIQQQMWINIIGYDMDSQIVYLNLPCK